MHCGVCVHDCELAHANCHTRSVGLLRMEFLLLWWDNLDDFAHACRHLATSAFSELAEVSSAAVPLLIALCAGLSATGAAILLHLKS